MDGFGQEEWYAEAIVDGVERAEEDTAAAAEEQNREEDGEEDD